MGLFNKPKKEDFPELPDNLYVAKVAKIAHKIGKTSGKEYISWGFELVQPPHTKRWVWGNTPPSVTPKSNAGKFLSVLGVDIDTIDTSFNEQTLVGKYVKVLLETKENEDTGAKFQNVTKLMALTEADIQLLQIWLAKANTAGPVQVAAQPVVAAQQPVLAAAPVSLPTQPVAPAAPAFVQPVQQPVQQPAPAAPRKSSAFPF
jgi:hypothetical protein